MLPYLTLPKSISKKIEGKNLTLDTLGASDSSVYIFDESVLKIEKTGDNANREAEACARCRTMCI